MDQQVLWRALQVCGYDLDAAIKGLNELHLGSADSESDLGTGTSNQLPSQGTHAGGDPASEDAVTQNNLPTNDSEWADLLLIEMMSASSMDDAKVHIIRVFEHKDKKSKEQVELLKRAVRIQYERQKGCDEMIQALQKQLATSQHEHQKDKQLLLECQMRCYELTVQLTRTLQGNSSIPDRFHPHVF